MTTQEALQILSRHLDEWRPPHEDTCAYEQSSGCGDPTKADAHCDCELVELDEAFAFIKDKLEAHELTRD